VTVPAVRLAEVFVEVADTRDAEFDLSGFLRLVTARAAELVTSDAVGLLVADPQGQLQFVAGSDETTAMLELFQLQHHEGPCLDSFRSGEPVINTDLADAADRWPRFAPAAVAAGFRSVHAIPLRRPTSDAVGVMGLFDTDTGRRPEDDTRIVQCLADVTTIRLLQERALQGWQSLADQLQTALTTRVVIEQAKGVLAQTYGVTVDEAFGALRAYARRHRQRLDDVARLVVKGPGPIPTELRPIRLTTR
jgi:hypothetical protein